MAPLIIVTHDHSASQATFVEIVFGLNAAFATIKKFRDYISLKYITKTSKYFADNVADAGASPTKDEKDKSRRDRLWSELVKYRLTHESAQAAWCKYAIVSTLIVCVLCVLIVYFDWLEAWGYFLALLFTPLAIYYSAAGCIFWKHRRSSVKIVELYVTFIIKFEEPLSQQINVYKALGEMDDDK